MLLTPGSDAAVRLICQHFVRSPASSRRLLLQFPNYFAWEQSAALLGLKIERVRWSNIFSAGRELIEAARSCRRALIGISIPNGPVGVCVSTDDLDKLIDAVYNQGHLLTIDSCYQAFNGHWTEYLRRHSEKVVVIQSLSKSHGLAGARLGVLTGHANLVEQLAESRLEHAVSSATLSIGCTVLESIANFEEIWNDIKLVREQAADALRGANIHVLPSGGNFLTFHVGSAGRAAAVKQSMSTYGYRIKHLDEDVALSDCLRMTIQDKQTTQKALNQLFEALSANTP
jgi:histidinol-phosphate/aromatic aminotransferase/cobyric acid decarboxylase-like protein